MNESIDPNASGFFPCVRVILCINPLPFLLAFRIINEEKVLLTGLPGYGEYMKKVKYRMIPFIW